MTTPQQFQENSVPEPSPLEVRRSVAIGAAAHVLASVAATGEPSDPETLYVLLSEVRTALRLVCDELALHLPQPDE